ncbi:hypothetical protein Misp01_01530 [Microtetraspora sp. NBRC 13810]|uniref:S8 family serine peptidase n=1 Tax=Microtetraspora sp. NBRC 13810 TaxID=3030990 RepID=UPI00249FA64D|nr:S8 family serine peptidase [Microtetraspora sp. NBRC 13810]GLW05023.1 hypothetical protein Misp01_01530 [Microtetraspora sp. NBRC 13810]
MSFLVTAGRGVLAIALAVLWTAAPATAEAEPARCRPAKGSLKVAEGWPQQRLGLPAVWPLTRGDGVTVAVVDSGVDPTHPQIRLTKSVDLTGTGYSDCVGHGTAVAGIIAGRQIAGVPYYGVAPGVRLISLKQTNSEDGDVQLLAEGIKRAADLGADVINVSVQAQDNPILRQAVNYALAKDIVIVAAAGNVTSEDGTLLPYYPASYEGVLAVGAAASDGRRVDSSSAGTPVAVLGPGKDITSTWTGSSYVSGLEGTSFAAPYVAGVAALVRARFPDLDEQQVRQRIIATADGTLGAGTGSGMVNPLLAVTAILPFEPADQPVIAPPPPAPLPPGAVAKVPPVDHEAVGAAITVGVLALSGAGLVLAGRVVLPLGRRRGWRPGRPTVSSQRGDGDF